MNDILAEFNAAALRRSTWLWLVIFWWLSASNDADKAEKKRQRRQREYQAVARPKPVRQPVPAPRFG